jgi:hypothetical protein
MKEKCMAPLVTQWSVVIEENAERDEDEKKNKKKKEYIVPIL